jgi:flagellin-like hook-associated protein FlgL
MFFGIGAYGIAIASTRLGEGWFAVAVGVAGALAVSLLLSLVIGLFSLRVKAMFYAMITLAVAAASATDATILSGYQTSFDNYRSDITDVATYTTLNGSSLMDGTTTSVSVQVGIAAGDSRSLSFSSATAAALLLSALDISTSASTAIDTIDTALVTIGNYQSLVGSHEKLMDYRETLSDNMILSLTSAYGNVMDADVAAETTNLATYQIRQEAAAAVLVQSNTITKEMVAYLLQSVTS